MATCFSYVRFSSEGQRYGTSLERQVELARNYATANGHTLDTATYRDLGISAFRSKNVENALGAFIQAVDTGKVPKGSLLLVENFDRLSRDTVDVALELVLSILRKGIIIVTLFDSQVYSSEIIKKDWTRIIIMLAIQARANEESSSKSRRALEFFAAKRKKGLIAHNRCPSWLTREGEKYTKIPEKVEVVNRVFDMVISGLGGRPIALQLNAEKIPTMHWALRWTQGRVAGLIRNEAVIGLLKGVEHYPPIMSKKKFLLARDVSRRRKWNTTRSAGIPNLFAGMIYCALCGERVRLLPSSVGGHLKCRKAVDTIECKGKRYSIDQCETAFIYTMTRKAGLDISGQFLVEQTTAGPTIMSEIEELKVKQRNLLKLATLAEGVEVIADELKTLQKQIAVLEAKLAAVNQVPITRKEVSEHRDLFDRYFQLKESGAVVIELRRQIRVAMSRMFKKIELGNGRLYLTLHR